MTAAIILHLGAHRTASTRLQADLDDNRDLLLSRGILALTPPRPGKRGDERLRNLIRAAAPALAQGWPRRTLARHRLRGELAALLAGAAGALTPTRLILSDEMLLDVAFAPDGTGLYPRAEPRLAAFRSLLPAPPAEVHLTIRDYASFIVSAYAMRAVYAGPLPPFADLAPRLTDPAAGWPELVAGLRRLFPEARLVISTLEGRPITARLADLAGAVLPFRHQGAEQPNVAPSLQAIQAACALPGRAPDPDALVAAHAGGDRFDPLSRARREALTARYDRDLDRLRADPALDFRG